jgi:hypothetical protein
LRPEQRHPAERGVTSERNGNETIDMNRKWPRQLHYITHLDNIPSILQRGILSHERVERDKVGYTRIYDEEIVANRQERAVPDGKSLWSFANLYFQPRNPMLFRVICEKSSDDIAIVAVRANIIQEPGVFVSDGNAASGPTRIFLASQDRESVSRIAKETDKEWWTEADGSKRRIMAEVLVPGEVSPDFIEAIYVASHKARDKVEAAVKVPSLSIIPEPKMFFQPPSRVKLTERLSVLEGDLFFSRMQTLTVSVNIVRVMGAGLASRAKYQFPDVYVSYQDLCRNKTLQMGKPYLYKRESPLDLELADEPSTLSNANSETWFLLFPTKRHWKEKADISAINKGLEWLQENYCKEEIKSLAIPALGCGLGWLKWEDVGPILCRSLSSLEIPVQLYLPAERKIEDKYLTKEFLLAERY